MLGKLNVKTTERIFSLPNVVGIGFGMKEVAGKLTRKKAIVVLVSKKVPKSKLAKAALVPKHIEGIVSDVIETGHIVARPEQMRGKNKNTSVIRKSRKSRWRPAPGGVSIGHYKVTAGTLGTVVYDKNTHKKLILSNNHVLANATTGKDHLAKIGDPVLQPGPLDGGTVKHDTIAKLSKFIPLKNRAYNVADAAVAKPSRSGLVNPKILCIGKVNGTISPRLGMRVKKSGRTTDLTNGHIRAVDVQVRVNYDGKIRKFRDQILTDSFDRPGDSGSLVVDNNNRAVGLLFAGSRKYTFANPIRPVLHRLGVQLVP